MVDASFLLELLLGRPEAVGVIDGELEDHEHEPLHAPELVELETLNALRRTVCRGVITDHHATAAASELERTRLVSYPHAPLRGRVWELRHNLSAYDASYLALAELLDDSVLITADGGLAGAAARSLGESRVRLVA